MKILAEYDLIVRRAKTREYPGKLVDIAISDGKIVDIKEKIENRGKEEIDAGGRLVTPPFVDAHLHMCKVYTYLMIGEEAIKHYHESEMGTSELAIILASKIKEKYNESWIYENVKKAALEAIEYGTLYIRAFVDTDTKAKLEGIKALLRVRDELKDKITIQVVAFPQDGVVRDPGAEEYVRKAIELGADVVGGIPWIEITPEDEDTHIERMFEIAKEFNRDVAMLTDDTGDPGLRTTEKLAKKAIKEGWKGRVTANHARAASMYTKPYLTKLAQLLKMADMSLITDPHTGPLHIPVKFFLSQGVNVALGQDDIADAYYPYGNNNMLEIAFLNSHILWMTTLQDMETLFTMITYNAAKAMRIENYGLHVGGRGDLLILNANSVYEAIWRHEKPLRVIRGGTILSHNH
ncbi:MAG: amidohydrolase family protein [Fervidicoccaceae archaeon]